MRTGSVADFQFHYSTSVKPYDSGISNQFCYGISLKIRRAEQLNFEF